MPAPPTEADVAGESRAEPGEFGSPCAENANCYSGWCVEGVDGYVCTKTCESDCPSGWECKSIVSGSSDVVFLCIPVVESHCAPCTADLQCSGGRCLEMGDGASHCAYSCGPDDPCPDGFECTDAPQADVDGTWCAPVTGTCTCFAHDGVAGTQRTCIASNELGSCYGLEVCDPELGWIDCDAASPVEESCDGLDNDCDGLVDESLDEGGVCENSVDGVGSCEGTWACLGPSGWLCQGAQPEPEVCNYADDDCDQAVDETFTAADGAYTLDANCGSCGNDCTDKFEGGTGICGGTADTPQCLVDTCDPGLVKISDFQCGTIPATPCQPLR